MNIGNLPSVNFYKTETGCKAGDKWLFPHHKVDEQPNEKPKKGHYSHTRRESDDKNVVATEKIVQQPGCVSQDSDTLLSKRQTVQKVLEPTQRVQLTKSTLRQASIPEKKGPSLGKIQVKHPQSLRYEI